MIKVDLITGFLGSGKTTFLKRYARFLLGRGQRIGILESDYGAVNVDMMLLRELEGDNCGLEMVAGACGADCHKRRFKTKLIALGMSGYDRVLIEPSGVFDIDEFFDVLYEPPLDRFYEAGSVIAVVDANLEDGLSESADYLLASQVANAGIIVLSKTQWATAEEQCATVQHIQSALKKVKCEKALENRIVAKDWDDFTDKDFERVMNSGYESSSFVKRGTTDDSGFGSMYFLNRSFTPDEFIKKAAQAFENKNCGNVFRVKGFARSQSGWLECNATRRKTDIRPISQGQDIVIVIGEKLKKDTICAIFNREIK